MTWAKWIVAALIVAVVVFAVLRRFRRAGGVIAVPSQLRPTATAVDSPIGTASTTGTASVTATPILNSNGNAAQVSE